MANVKYTNYEQANEYAKKISAIRQLEYLIWTWKDPNDNGTDPTKYKFNPDFTLKTILCDKDGNPIADQNAPSGDEDSSTDTEKDRDTPTNTITLGDLTYTIDDRTLLNTTFKSITTKYVALIAELNNLPGDKPQER